MNEAEVKKPRFTIVIPTTGRVELVKLSLPSVLAQTFHDFDLWIVDSGYSEELAQYVETVRDPRIHLVHPPDKRPFSTWDYGAHVAEGEYVMWLDDDNYLLPFALELFDAVARESGADVITGTHLYYYDKLHPRTYLRNSVGVLPYTDTQSAVAPHDVLRALFSFARRGPGSSLPRLHFSATIYARPVVKCALDRLGFVVFADMPNMHSLQPILFAFAQSCRYVDHPVVIIGRLGVSMGQIWSTAAKDRFARLDFKFTHSPLTGHARINGILESFLRTQDRLSELKQYPIDYVRFAELYMKELLYLDSSFDQFVRNWRNLFTFTKTLPSARRVSIEKQARRFALFAPFVFISRRLKLHTLWRSLYGKVVAWKERNRKPNEEVRLGEEFAFPAGNLEIDSVLTLAPHIGEIWQKKLGRDLYDWRGALKSASVQE